MEPPKSIEVRENETSVWWVEEQRLLVSISKKNPPDLTREQSLGQLKEVREVIGDKKVCVLLDITFARPGKREDREFAAEELNKLVKAMALVSTSSLGKMVANLFFNLKPPPYPAKMFTNETEARQWLTPFL